jgi:drug/metabolite transporter (DMT)-like permease
MKRQTRAYIYAFAAVLLWSTVATAFKIALRDLSYLQLLFYSSLTAFIVLFILLVVTKKRQELKLQSGKDFLKSAFAGLLNPFLYYMVLFKAYELLPAQEALALNYSWAVMVVIMSIIFLKQKIRFFGVAGILVSFLGLVLIATKGNLAYFDLDEPLGVALAFGSSLIWAVFWIYNLRDKRDVLIKLFLSFAFGFVFISALMLFQGISPVVSLQGLLAAVYVGLFEMGITFVLWLNALKLSENTAKVSSLIYLSPFISLNLINIILGEKILISTIIGVVLIVGGILIQKLEKQVRV